MKYTILGFSQKKLVELDIPLDEALILRYFVDFKDSGKMAKEYLQDDVYYWINYETLKRELQILGISRDRVYRKLKHLTKLGVLKHKTKKQGGTFSFYAIGSRYVELISSSVETTDDTVKIPGGYGENTGAGKVKIPEGYGGNNGTKDSSIKDSSINNPSTKDNIRVNWENINLAWNNLPNPINPIKYITTKRKDKIIARMKSLKIDQQDILIAIENINKSKFLQGENNEGWVIDFDWLFKDDNSFTKVFENKYVNKEKSNRSSNKSPWNGYENKVDIDYYKRALNGELEEDSEEDDEENKRLKAKLFAELKRGNI